MDEEVNRRRRRTYSAEFRAEAVLACRKPGASTAAEALKRQGIHYVLISRSAPFEDTFRDNLPAWHLHQIVSTKAATLYRID